MRNEKKNSAMLCVYLAASILCMLLSLVVGFATGGSFPPKLACSFLCPLTGSLPVAVLYIADSREQIAGRMHIYNFGIVLMTTGCIAGGITDILDKAENLTSVIFAAGAVAAAAGLAVAIKDFRISRKKITR